MYVDTSALLKLLVAEAESDELTDHLDRLDMPLVTSEFTLAELHRNASRLDVAQDVTDDLLEQVALLAVTTDVLRRTGRLPARGDQLRTADALHVASAMLSGAATFCSYDTRQARVADSFGFRLVSPGRPADWYAG